MLSSQLSSASMRLATISMMAAEAAALIDGPTGATAVVDDLVVVVPGDASGVCGLMPGGKTERRVGLDCGTAGGGMDSVREFVAVDGVSRCGAGAGRSRARL